MKRIAEIRDVINHLHGKTLCARELAELGCIPNCKPNWELSGGSLAEYSFSFALPDPLRALVDTASLMHGVEDKTSEVTFFSNRPEVSLENLIPTSAPLIAICSPWCSFLRAELPLLEIQQGNHEESVIPLLNVWLRIDPLTSLTILKNWGHLIDLPFISSSVPKQAFGILFNQLHFKKNSLGIFSLAQFSPSTRGFEVLAFDESCSPYPGLREYLESIQTLEEAVDELAQISRKSLSNNIRSAQRTFALAREASLQGEHKSAIPLFQESAKLGHSEGLRFSNEVRNKDAASIHQRYPHIFDNIRRGERLRILTELRLLQQTEPEWAAALLSYCLRGTDSAEEGLAACEQALELNGPQPDLLANKWFYLFELGEDEAALATATEHLTQFPYDNSANTNLIDSLLLLKQPDAAALYALRYFILSDSLQLSVSQLFKAFEGAAAWAELVGILDSALPLIPGPSTETLCCYGESLIEVGRIEDSLCVLEQAVVIEPGSSKAALGYGRALAQAEREEEAKAFLSTVLSDKNRIDKVHERALLVTLLAEITRRTATAEEAIIVFETYLEDDPITLTRRIGPMPGLEYAESLFLSGRTNQAREAAFLLHEAWPGNAFVEEFLQIVSEIPQHRAT